LKTAFQLREHGTRHFQRWICWISAGLTTFRFPAGLKTGGLKNGKGLVFRMKIFLWKPFWEILKYTKWSRFYCIIKKPEKTMFSEKFYSVTIGYFPETLEMPGLNAVLPVFSFASIPGL
jgi:hypothetical protein